MWLSHAILFISTFFAEGRLLQCSQNLVTGSLQFNKKRSQMFKVTTAGYHSRALLSHMLPEAHRASWPSRAQFTPPRIPTTNNELRKRLCELALSGSLPRPHCLSWSHVLGIQQGLETNVRIDSKHYWLGLLLVLYMLWLILA